MLSPFHVPCVVPHRPAAREGCSGRVSAHLVAKHSEEDADGPKIQQYIDKFKIDYQLVSAQGLYNIVPPEAAAYCLFNGLPQYFKDHMNRRTAPGPYQNIRTDMEALLLEINMTMHDSSCAGEMACKGRRAMGAATEIKHQHQQGADRRDQYTSVRLATTLESLAALTQLTTYSRR